MERRPHLVCKGQARHYLKKRAPLNFIIKFKAPQWT
jgi:hypothetical protein